MRCERMNLLEVQPPTGRRTNIAVATAAVTERGCDFHPASHSPYLFSGLPASRLFFAASDLLSVCSEPPFSDSEAAAALWNQDGGVQYLASSAAPLPTSRLHSLFDIFTPRRSDVFSVYKVPTL